MNDKLIEYLYEIMENYSEQAWEYGALKKAIEALNPVDDAEVQEALNVLAGLPDDAGIGSLIERLVREKTELENRPHDEVLLHDMELMQQRIEELEAKVKEQSKHIAVMARALAEIKATDDGHSDQEVGTILSWSIEQIAALKESE